MAVTLNANTSTGFIATSDTSGVLQLQTGGTTAVTISSGQVATFAQAPVLPAASIPQAALAANVAGNGPAFSAYRSGAQAITATVWTKVAAQVEEFDTNSNYDTSLYRFTPTVAGYYQFNATVEPALAQAYQYLAFYKNGSEFKRAAASNTSGVGTSVAALIYLNGSTDYIELYTFFGSTLNMNGDSVVSFFQGFLARSAT